MMPPEPVLIILAAGASKRLGEPKALVALHGCTPVEHLGSAWRTAAGNQAPSVVISGAHHALMAAALAPGIELLHNPNWSAGRTGGLALAAQRWPGRDLLVAPVDCPLVPASVFSALLERWQELGLPARAFLAPYVQPAGEDACFGHPVFLGRDLAAGLHELGPEVSLRDIRDQATPLLGLAVSNREILDNLDTPAALAELRGRAWNRTSDGHRP